MSKKNIIFIVGAALCVMAAIASIGWVVATEISKERQAAATKTERTIDRTDQGTPRTPDQEIVVKDKTSAKQMLDVLNRDMSTLEREGAE
jgi:hypothetical protein